MRHFIPTLLLAFLALLQLAGCRAIRRTTGTQPVSHQQWDVLVKKHVDADGFVHYQNFLKDTLALQTYLQLLEKSHPDAETWSRNDQMAYWINAYNAYTVKLILEHYPVESIKDIKKGIAFINSVWDIKFIHIGTYRYDLNNIEHNILRKVFKDARIHAAINCASFSCPKLLPEAFTADRLDTQLEGAMTGFINDPSRNRVTEDRADISEIFKWFKGDFERDAGSVRAFINRYAREKVRKNGDIDHINYDWRLNESKR